MAEEKYSRTCELIKIYLETFSPSEFAGASSVSVDSDVDVILGRLVAMYSHTGSSESVVDKINSILSDKIDERMLQIAHENFRCV